MNIKHIKPLDAESYRFFHCAVTDIEAAKPYWRKKQYEQFVALLQKSACCLAKALLSSKSIVVSDNKSLSDLASAIDEISDIDNPVYSNIHSILTYVANTDKNEGLREIYREYQGTLIETRKILARDLNYNSRIREKFYQTIFTAAGLKKLFPFIMMLVILVMLPAGIHHFFDPIDMYELDGQVFWKSRPGIPFSSKESKHFPVISDNKSREYTIDLDSTENIFLLRIDPVNAIGLTDVEIEEISL
ncbi:MAG: hypothetical protein KAJ95_05545, partial [Gammaproteobacteria bacterium]|nr:hypothetical protein [Gammaproteobacteria bacterium]